MLARIGTIGGAVPGQRSGGGYRAPQYSQRQRFRSAAIAPTDWRMPLSIPEPQQPASTEGAS
jgi:hypothetical protein